MVSENNPVKINAIEKAELCKRHAIDIFTRNIKKEKNDDKAYAKASQSLDNAIIKHKITNMNQINGLKAELFFYKQNYREFKLHPTFAAGLHSDFTGIINKNPSAFDITTNASIKDESQFIKIKEDFGNDWDYYIGLVDLQDTTIDLNPLTLPICSDGTTGHFMLIIFESDLESLGGNSDSQLLVKYNPNAKDDDDAIEEIIGNYNYLVTHPELHFDVLINQIDEYFPDQDLFGDFNYFCNDIASQFKRISGLVVSSIVSSRHTYQDKDLRDERWETRKYWVHPHQYIQKSIGVAHEDLGHNIADMFV